MTETILRQPSWRSNDMMYKDDESTYATAVAVSACGNFCVVGNRGGSIHRYNLQSGLARGSYPSSASAENLKAGHKKKKMNTVGNVYHASKTIIGEYDETSATGYLASSLLVKQQKKENNSVNNLNATALTNSFKMQGHIGSSVTGLFIDAMNEVMVSTGNDNKGLILFWTFDTIKVVRSIFH